MRYAVKEHVAYHVEIKTCEIANTTLPPMRSFCSCRISKAWKAKSTSKLEKLQGDKHVLGSDKMMDDAWHPYNDVCMDRKSNVLSDTLGALDND